MSKPSKLFQTFFDRACRWSYFLRIALVCCLPYPITVLLGWADWACILVFTTPTGGNPNTSDALRAGAFFLSWGAFHVLAPIFIITASILGLTKLLHTRYSKA